MTCVYGLVFFGLAVRQFNVFGCDLSVTADYNNTFWWTIHGKPFASTTYQGSGFGMHSSFFLVLLVPFYWLLPSVYTLYFLQTLAISLSGIPVYFLARRILQHEWAALFGTAAYLFHPAIVSRHVGQFQEPSFVTPFLASAIYFFVAKRFGWFIVFAVLTCSVREQFPLLVAMFGVWAWLDKRGWKWVTVPLVGGGAYFALVLFIIMPAFRAGQPWHVTNHYFDYLGTTPGEILGTALRSPWILVHHLFKTEVVTYVVLLTQSTGYVLPFLSAPILVGLPEFLINLFTGSSQMRVVSYHYNVGTALTMFASTIVTIRKINDKLRTRFQGGDGYSLVMAVALLLLALSQWLLWLSPQQFQQLPQHSALTRALNVVPENASVLVQPKMLAHVSSRAKWDDLGVFWDRARKLAPRSIDPEHCKSFDYVILDINDKGFLNLVTPEAARAFYQHPSYKLVFAENNVFVFNRVAPVIDPPVR